MSLDSIFAVHEKSLELHAKRTQVLASNLANSDTPGYKARDIDFKEVLSNALSNKPEHLVTTNPLHLGDDELLVPSDLKYRVPLQTKADGNTVDTQVENSKFAENSLRYIASLKLLDTKIKNLMLSLRGE